MYFCVDADQYPYKSGKNKINDWKPNHKILIRKLTDWVTSLTRFANNNIPIPESGIFISALSLYSSKTISMYTPSSFKEENPKVLFELIQKYNFGILFSQHGETPEATHLPFLVDKGRGAHGTLIAHFARANKHWKTLDESMEVLAVFQGPHTYITPSWYKNRETVPTWNYATVHVYGKPKVIHELDELRAMVARLTHFHEGQVDSDWSLEESRENFEVDLKAITGLEIEVTRMEGKFKFNQNKKEEDQRGVIENLEKLGEKEVSGIMRGNLRKKS